MEKLEQSNKWIPQFELIERIRKEEKTIRQEALKIAKERAKTEKEKVIEKIARGFKTDGIAVAVISKNTGLTKEEIEKLK